MEKNKDIHKKMYDKLSSMLAKHAKQISDGEEALGDFIFWITVLGLQAAPCSRLAESQIMMSVYRGLNAYLTHTHAHTDHEEEAE